MRRRDILLHPLRYAAVYLYYDHMRRLGLANTMRLFKTFNRLRRWGRQGRRERLGRTRMDELLAETGGPRSPLELDDGFVIDSSLTLPGLEPLLDAARQVIDERGRRLNPKDEKKPYFVEMMSAEEMADHPAIIEFCLSAALLEVVSRYLGCIPVLSRTRPPGVRFMESYAGYAKGLDRLTESQFYHLDHHDSPLMYVLVLLEDVTEECGPFTFLPASVSEVAARGLRYRKRGEPYRVTDERMYEHVDPSEAIPFTYPRGTVLFIDTNRCFHYGSRNAVSPRYQMMYTFTTACRTDGTELYHKRFDYAIPGELSGLQEMVMDPDHLCRLPRQLPAPALS